MADDGAFWPAPARLEYGGRQTAAISRFRAIAPWLGDRGGYAASIYLCTARILALETAMPWCCGRPSPRRQEFTAISPPSGIYASGLACHPKVRAGGEGRLFPNSWKASAFWERYAAGRQESRGERRTE